MEVRNGSSTESSGKSDVWGRLTGTFSAQRVAGEVSVTELKQEKRQEAEKLDLRSLHCWNMIKVIIYVILE